MTVCICEFCKCYFIRKRNTIGHFCSGFCYHKAQSEGATRPICLRGNTRRVKSRINVCLQCNVEFHPWNTRPSGKFCCRQCSDEWKKGRPHPMKQMNGKKPLYANKKTSMGYILTYVPKHPKADNGGYILQHRHIMEQHLSRYLSSDEIVHHKNCDRADNRLENLELVVRRKHPAKDWIPVNCPKCGCELQATSH